MKEEALFGKCPFLTTQKVLQGKWSILIMYHISSETIRFNELQRRLPDMTHATLAKQLKQLEKDGLIIRTEYAQLPPKVEYSLSQLGKGFEEVLKAVEMWGEQYIDYLKQQEELA